jgi:hypothetical protein
MSESVPVVEQARISPQHLRALRKVYERLHASGLNWVVCAGMNLALQGVPVSVHDIDLETDAAGAYEIERLFAECVASPVVFSSTDRIRSHFGALSIEGIIVEIIGDMEILSEDGRWERTAPLPQQQLLVQVGDTQIPVLSLEYECEAYHKLGRHEKAELVRKWLDQRQQHQEVQTPGFGAT